MRSEFSCFVLLSSHVKLSALTHDSGFSVIYLTGLDLVAQRMSFIPDEKLRLITITSAVQEELLKNHDLTSHTKSFHWQNTGVRVFKRLP